MEQNEPSAATLSFSHPHGILLRSRFVLRLNVFVRERTDCQAARVYEYDDIFVFHKTNQTITLFALLSASTAMDWNTKMMLNLENLEQLVLNGMLLIESEDGRTELADSLAFYVLIKTRPIRGGDPLATIFGSSGSCSSGASGSGTGDPRARTPVSLQNGSR